MTDILPDLNLFFNNKYTKWYYSIINHATNQVNIGYTENHHIIPHSIGGGELTKIRLSPRQHFVCHLLLRKMVISQYHKYKMTHAATAMLFYKSKHHKREFKVSSKLYATLKAEKAKALSISRMGWSPSSETRKRMSESQKGRKLSEEQKQKISLFHRGNSYTKGRKLSEEHKAKIHGYKHTKEAKTKMTISRTGIHLSESHKKAIADGNKGIKPAQSTIDAVIKANSERIITDSYREKLSQRHIGKIWIWEPITLKSTFVTKDVADIKISEGWIKGRGKLTKNP